VVSSTGVEASGLGAEVVSTDHAEVAATGNTLLSCGTPWLSCEWAQHGRGQLFNDFWRMEPYDSDDNARTAASSAATLTVPDGATISWAGLYWSGTGSAGSTALLGATPDSYTTIRSSRVEDEKLHGTATYQAFADVTAQVKAGGTWWVGLPQAPAGGRDSYAGWSLVVVANADSLPERQVAVFDGLNPVDRDAAAINFALGPSGAGSGQVSTVAWEGDRGLTGDQVDLDGQSLADCSGLACDMEDSTAQGAIPNDPHGKRPDVGRDPGGHCHRPWPECAPGSWNTFGTDVHTYPVQVAASDEHRIRASTVSDVFSLGVVGVSLPPK
jgi:hypothetical protein